MYNYKHPLKSYQKNPNPLECSTPSEHSQFQNSQNSQSHVSHFTLANPTSSLKFQQPKIGYQPIISTQNLKFLTLQIPAIKHAPKGRNGKALHTNQQQNKTGTTQHQKSPQKHQIKQQKTKISIKIELANKRGFRDRDDMIQRCICIHI